MHALLFACLAPAFFEQFGSREEARIKVRLVTAMISAPASRDPIGQSQQEVLSSKSMAAPETARRAEATRRVVSVTNIKKSSSQQLAAGSPPEPPAGTISVPQVDQPSREIPLLIGGLEASLEAEDLYRASLAKDAWVDARVGEIVQLIEDRWSRPPSARNGMETQFMMHLTPAGELVRVAVLKSSGNQAFDRAAEQAIHSVGSFPVPVDEQLFERYFRVMKVVFRPADLQG